MKIAIVHDQLQEFGGAERVLVALKKIYPEADVFTSFYSPEKLGIHADKFKDWKIFSSWADRIPFIKRLYSPLRFITPYIWESFSFKSYNLVISSSGSYMSKGIITRPETTHISYLHHPPRYLYYYETAIEWQKHLVFKIYGHLINHDLRQWDYLSSQRPDYFITNSRETQKRTEKFYRRDSKVIYPPVTIPKIQFIENSKLKIQNYYITVSRLAKAKHIDILVKTANKYKFKIKIVGSGRDEDYLKSIAGETVEFINSATDEELPKLISKAKAFLFSSVDEEFGIAPVEAMGNGTPVIAFSSGGLKETIIEGVNGYLFESLTPESLHEKIKKLESLSKEEYETMRKNSRKEAEKYSFEVFKENIIKFVEEKVRL